MIELPPELLEKLSNPEVRINVERGIRPPTIGPLISPDTPQPKFEEYPLRARIMAWLISGFATYGAGNLLWKVAAALWG